jgi:S-DNA-T family DNA segregation ATPase FtsK/SpoIIIE
MAGSKSKRTRKAKASKAPKSVAKAPPASTPAPRQRSPRGPILSAERRRIVRYSLILLLCGLVSLAWLSMLSYDPTDPPSPAVYPPKEPVSNAAGIVGAHVAFALRYWLGAGSYMALLFATVSAVILVLGGRISHAAWRVVGTALLVTATSSALFMLTPAQARDGTTGLSGILGSASGTYIETNFGTVGGWIVVLVVFLIGLLLTVDQLVLSIPRAIGKAHRARREASSPARQDDGSAGADAPRKTRRDAHDLGARKGIAAAVQAVARTLSLARPSNQARPGADATGAGDAPRAVGPTNDDRPSGTPDPDKADASGKKKRTFGGLFGRGSGKNAKDGGGAGARTANKPSEAAKRPRRKAASASSSVSRKPEGAEGDYPLPSMDLLVRPEGGYAESQEEQARDKRDILQQTLDNFGVEAEVVGFQTGPVITLFELSLAAGVKVAQVTRLETDVARALAVPAVRVVSPLPGRDTIGIEVPNLDKETVRLRELMQMAPEAMADYHLPLFLGKDAGGDAIVADLSRMPHMLIAGTTGSGKSVCINTIITSLLMTRRPETVRFVLADPKMVEMAAYENIPHLLCPIVTDMGKAEDILEWACTKMDERYALLREAGVRNIDSYNRLTKKERYERFAVEDEEEKKRIPGKLPYWVLIIDELADLMMTSTKEVEGYIIRIAQKARAVGIHMVLATQRPSADVVTGLIKSNVPCRVSFRVASRQESRIVLDQNGADALLGQGDMLFLQPGTSNLVRAQGAFVDDREIHKVVKELCKHGEPKFNHELVKIQNRAPGDVSMEKDELFDKAVEIVLAARRGSVSLLQRRLGIGYGRASRIIDQMAEAGLLGEHKGSQARECLITLDDWQEMRESIAADQDGSSSLNGEPTSA